jgi:hypothetical protein
VKTREAVESPSAPATPPTNARLEAAATTKDMATAAAAGVWAQINRIYEL